MRSMKNFQKLFMKIEKSKSDNYLCTLIQTDSIDDFIIYITKNSYSLDSTIDVSVYETNSFLLKNRKSSLIEYAAFYGSIQIFNYLRFNQIELKPSLWKYAIHGRNSQIIHLLEEYHIDPLDNYEELFKESIKCHHNDIADYIQNNYLNKNDNSNDTLINNLKYYNFSFIQNDLIDKSLFYYFCRYDYYLIAVNFINEIPVVLTTTLSF